jgi:hypothetical protein
MNDSLCKEFTKQEVVEASKNIGDLKIPGPDGMPSIFYKKLWDMVGEKLIEEVTSVLNRRPMPPN